MQSNPKTRAKRQRSDPQKSLVGFFVGDVHYAVDIACVLQIQNPYALTVLPHLDGVVAGVAEIRGEVIPVLDLRARFGLPPGTPSRRNKWVLVGVGERKAALAVDSVSDVFGKSSVTPRAAPPLGQGDAARGIVGVCDVAGRLTFLLATAHFHAILEALDAPSLSAGGTLVPPVLSKATT